MSVIAVVWSVYYLSRLIIYTTEPKGPRKDLLDRLSVITAADRNHL